jgi:tetratricopeptide (TPR) repeat protein
MNAFVLALSALASLQLGGDAAQQASDPAHRVVVEAPDPADRIAADAYKLFANRRAWPRAARLLERSATMRSPEDPERAAAFVAAGRVYTAIGAPAEARRVFEAGADAAAARGAIVEAAHAYLDAAIAAALAGDRTRASSLLDRGALLASSPHLAVQEKDAIMRRIPDETAGRG